MTICVGYSKDDETPVAITTDHGIYELTVGAARVLAQALLLIVDQIDREVTLEEK